MTLYDLLDQLEQLRSLNRLDDSLKVIILHPDKDVEENPPIHIISSAPVTSITLQGRELIISCL